MGLARVILKISDSSETRKHMFSWLPSRWINKESLFSLFKATVYLIFKCSAIRLLCSTTSSIFILPWVLSGFWNQFLKIYFIWITLTVIYSQVLIVTHCNPVVVTLCYWNPDLLQPKSLQNGPRFKSGSRPKDSCSSYLYKFLSFILVRGLANSWKIISRKLIGILLRI